MMNEVAEILVKAGCVKFNTKKPFKYTSGIQSPVYTDCRLLISHPRFREKIAGELAGIIKNINGVEAVCGTASAGIPWAAWTSSILEKPMTYTRSKAKQHGLRKKLEGTIPAGSKAVVVEDLVSSGVSSIGSVKTLREKQLVCQDVVCIFTYNLEESAKAFMGEDIQLHCASTLDDVLEYCRREKILDEGQADKIYGWRLDPGGWRP